MNEAKQLTVPERAAVALESSKHEQELVALAKKYSDIVEIKNPAGREQAHGAMMELANRRIAITKTGKEARDDATKFSKAIIEEEKRLVALIEPEEGRLRSLRDAWDEERESEKQAKLAAEKARVDGIRTKIDQIKDSIVFAMGKSAAEIQGAINELSAHGVTLEEFMEFAGEAEMAKVASLAKLNEALVAQQTHEAEQDRLAAERVELERLRVDAAERERVAAAARAEQEAKDRAERERVETEQRAAREKAEAAMRAEREAHEARMAAEREELARQQAEIAAAKAEQNRIERERLAAVEAEARAKREAEEVAAKAEAERQEAERRAAEQERIRREQIEFEKCGPAPEEILSLIAEHWDVGQSTAQHWLAIHNWHVAVEIAA